MLKLSRILASAKPGWPSTIGTVSGGSSDLHGEITQPGQADVGHRAPWNHSGGGKPLVTSVTTCLDLFGIWNMVYITLSGPYHPPP